AVEVLDTERQPFEGPRVALREARVAFLGLRQRPFGRRQDVGVERAVAGLDRLEERLRQLGGGEPLTLQPRARLGQRQLGEIGHGQATVAWANSGAKPGAVPAPVWQSGVRWVIASLDPTYSTTFGTAKKWSSRAGAFLTMSSAIPPSVTTSARFLRVMGITRVI